MEIAPTTVLGQVERLGRHCLLFHERHRPKGPLAEPLVVDGFESFEYSQYHPLHFHTAVGAHSQFFHAFTDSELRRKGRMTDLQKKRRAELEAQRGRPDPRSIELEMAALLALVVPEKSTAEIRSDEHPAYPRAVRRLHDRNRRMIDSAGEGIIGLDQDGLCTFVNAAALGMLGFEREELLGRVIDALGRPIDGGPPLQLPTAGTAVELSGTMALYGLDEDGALGSWRLERWAKDNLHLGTPEASQRRKDFFLTDGGTRPRFLQYRKQEHAQATPSVCCPRR